MAKKPEKKVSSSAKYFATSKRKRKGIHSKKKSSKCKSSKNYKSVIRDKDKL